MIPMICVLLFSLIGTWMMIDPLPGYLLLNFPELVGRLTLGVIYNIVTLPPVIELFVRIAPQRSLLFYMRFMMEMQIMLNTPLGVDPLDVDPEEFDNDDE